MYIIESVDLCNKIKMKKKKKKDKTSCVQIFPITNVIICSILYFVTYKTHLITPKIIFLNHQRSCTTIFIKTCKNVFLQMFSERLKSKLISGIVMDRYDSVVYVTTRVNND